MPLVVAGVVIGLVACLAGLVAYQLALRRRPKAKAEPPPQPPAPAADEEHPDAAGEGSSGATVKYAMVVRGPRVG